MIRSLIIDDEENGRSALQMLVHEYCPDVRVLESCSSAADGLRAIVERKPDLIFLDIEMPLMTGFDLLEKISHLPISVIFTTAFHQYAIKAIRYSALDYLLKPIDPEELIAAVGRYRAQLSKPVADQFRFLMDKLAQKEHTHRKLAIPNMEGFKLVSVDEIVSCEADDNYTHINLKNKSRITASRTLKEIQQLLEDYDLFIRIHHGYLVNLREVSQYIRGEGGYVIMTDGSHFNVSRNKKEALLRHLIR
ncbi:MAG TPA: response regulator [Saprospiraceae bacterium]|nr:response regulator [Saprospiraceae bacterium]HNT19152.1 response regulator [Saprospiraceae bacterium]